MKKPNRNTKIYKEACRKRQLKIWKNPEYREKMIKIHKGQMTGHKWKKGDIIKHDKQFKKGNKPWNDGIPHSEETKEKLRQYVGEKSANWQGGISFEPYSTDWTDVLRRSIRLRDNNICQLCEVHQDEEKRVLSVHHIDYDKKNCDPKNLITLCHSCHTKTNYNREKWMKFFQERVENDY